MNYDDLKSVELVMLKRFSDICTKYNLRYSLHFGTLLGCIRHKGFIPWDDDIDVMMPMEDYKVFASIAADELGEDYFFQNNETDNLNRSFAKIRKNNTCVVTSLTHKQKLYNQGVFIDIFPIGYLPRNKFIQFVQKIILELIGQINTTYCIEKVTMHKRLTIKSAKLILLILNKIIPSKFRTLLYEFIISWGNPKNSNYLCGYYAEQRDFMKTCKFEKDLFDDLIAMKFEQYNFLVPATYDELLTQLYGDYMKLPPKNERKTHGFYYYNLNVNYEEYVKKQNKF